MKNLLMILLAVAVAGAIPLAAGAQQLFDFNGQTILPDSTSNTLSMYSEIFDATPATTPIPLDFNAHMYTVVVSGLILGDVDNLTEYYFGGVLSIYQDDVTAADFSNLSTFTDGTVILSGTFNFLRRTMFTPTLGTVVGQVAWTDGSRLDDIAPWDQDDWGFFSGINSRFDQVLPGFDERWDGKIEPREPIVADEDMSWGSVKALFH